LTRRHYRAACRRCLRRQDCVAHSWRRVRRSRRRGNAPADGLARPVDSAQADARSQAHPARCPDARGQRVARTYVAMVAYLHIVASRHRRRWRRKLIAGAEGQLLLAPSAQRLSEAQWLRTVRSSSRSRSGSATMSISTILRQQSRRLLRKQTTCRGYETGTSSRARPVTRGHSRHAAND
jgi:hypothetical protein